jgi:CheY-like chemotaxis protein
VSDLPAAAETASIDAAGPSDAPLRTVLYVEDNPANLELVGQLIARRSDLRLISAPDAPLGIHYARTCQPHLILMDINLPGMSGLEALEVLRSDPATSRIPVIALSANAVPRDIDRALAAGFFNYITKPIVVGKFMLALESALLQSPHAGVPAGPEKT